MRRHSKTLEKIFKSYSSASKRGVKIIVLKQFKLMLRDLKVIPHIISEYKSGQVFKYLDSSKITQKDYPEEILTLETFPISMYIVFSLILESSESV